MRQGLSLYEITEALNQIEDEVLTAAWEGEGEEVSLPEEMIRVLDSLKLEATEKILELGKLLKNWRGEIGAVKAEENRLKDKRKRLEDGVDRVRGYILEAMDSLDERKLSIPGIVTVSKQKTPARVEIEGEVLTRDIRITVLGPQGGIEREVLVEGVEVPVPDSVEDEFVTTQVALYIAKKKAKEHWAKTGEVPEGLRIVDDGQTVAVR